jgi:hypothetical protein
MLIKNTNRLIVVSEIIALHSDNYTKHINIPYGQM